MPQSTSHVRLTRIRWSCVSYGIVNNRTTISWVGGSSLTKLAGKTVKMKVRMTDAKIYSASFKCDNTQ
eukprot:SAG22_NODE_2721_length_2282_cov_1.488319_2_plen_68_part_00